MPEPKADITLTRKEARALIDLLIDNPATEGADIPKAFVDLADMLDTAQGNTSEEEPERITLEIQAGEI